MKTSLKAKLTSLTLGLTMALGGLVGLGAEAAKGANAVDTYSKTNSIQAGDTVVLVCETAGTELTSISSTTSTKYGIGTKFSGSPAGTFPFDVVAGSETGSFSFKNGSKYLRWNSGNSLDMVATSVAKNSSWFVTFDNDKNAKLTNANDSTRSILWNVGSPRFATYQNQTVGNSYYATQLYKKETTGTGGDTPTKTLTSISVSGTPTKTTYSVGSSFDPTGLAVTGTYDDNSTETISNGIEWSFSPATFTTEGTTSVSVTAKYGDFTSEPFVVNNLSVISLKTYSIISNASDLEDGMEFVLVYNTASDYYISNNINTHVVLTHTTSSTSISGLIAGSTLTSMEAMSFWLEASGNDWLIKNSDGKYLSFTGIENGNDVFDKSDNASTFSASIKDNKYILFTVTSQTGKDRVWRMNTSSHDMRNYASNSGVGDVYMFAIGAPEVQYNVTNTFTSVSSNGAQKASNKRDYVATLTPAEGYDLVTLNSVAVGSSILTSGQDYTFTNNVLTIKKASIKGNITINAQASKSEYTVSASGTGVSFVTDGTDPQKASYKTDYSITFTVLPGYNAPTSVSATCDGNAVPASLSGTTVTISAANVTGNLVITANGTLKTYTLLTTGLSNITLENETTSFTHGQEFSTKLDAVTGYTLNNATITVTMGGETVPNAYNASTNTITISSVTGNIVISGSAIRVLESSIEINETTFDVKKDIQNATIEITWSNATINNVSVGLDTAQSTSNVASFGEFQRESSGNSGTVTVSADSNTTGGQSYYKVTVSYTNHLGNPDTKVFTILVKVAVDSLESISLSSTSGTFKLGDTITLPTVIGKYSLTGETEVEATWTEYDPYLVGTQTVTASFGGKTASYILKIEAKDYTTYTEAKEEYSYDKVTSNLTDWTGKYLIVCEDDGSHGDLAFDGSLATLDAVGNTVGVTISDNKIETDENGIIGNKAFYFEVEHISGSNSAYTLKSASGYYISGTAKTNKASNGLKQASGYSDYEIYFNNLEIESKSKDKNMVLRYNNTSGQTRFRFYSSGQQSISLYKFTDHSVQASSTPSDEKHAVTCYSAGFYGEAAYAGKEADLSQFAMDILFDTNVRQSVAPTSISPSTFVEGEYNYTITYEDGYGQKLEKTLSISAVPESFEVIPMITTYLVNTGVQTYDYNAIFNDKLINNGECKVTPTQFTDTGVQTVTVKYGDFEDSYEVLVIDSSYYNRLTFVVNQDAYINGNLKTNSFYWGNDLFNIEFGGKTFSFNNSIFSCEINCISRNNPLTPWDFYTKDYKGALGVESGFADGIAIKDVMSNEAIYDTYDKFKVRFDGEGIAEYYIDAHESNLCDYPEIYEDENVPMNLGNYKAYHFDYATGQSTDVTESVVWTRDKSSGNSCYIHPTINGEQFDRAFAARIKTIEPTKYANELKSLDGLNVGDVIVLGVEDPMSSYLLGAGIFSGSTMVTASANYTVSNSGEPGTIGIVDAMDYYRITQINGNEITCTAKDNASFTFTISIDNAANATVTYSGATAYYNKDSNRFEFMPQTAVGSNPSYVLPHIYFYRDYTPFGVEQLTHSFIYEGDTVYLGYSENGSTGYSAGYFSFGDLSAPGIATTFKNGSMDIQYSTDGLVLGNYNETNKTFSLKDTQLNQNFYGDWSMSVNEKTKEATITCPDGGYQIFFDTSANNFVISMVGADAVYTNYKLPTAYVERTAQTYAQEYFDYYLRFGYYDSTVEGTGECTSMGYYNKAKMRLAQIMNKPGVINALLLNQEALARLNEWARNNNEQLDLNTGSFVPLVKSTHNLFGGVFDDNPILNEVATPKGLYISLIVVGVGIAAIGATGLKFKRKED